MHEPDDVNVALFQLFRQFSNLQLRYTTRYYGQGLILISLKNQGPLTQKELTSITKRRAATVSEQLDNMEEAGYVLREKNADDRRSVDVKLTKAGYQAALEAEQVRYEVASRLFAALDEEEKWELRRMLTKIVTFFDQEVEGENE